MGKKLKVGSVVVFDEEHRDVTQGRHYTIKKDYNGEMYVLDNAGDENNMAVQEYPYTIVSSPPKKQKLPFIKINGKKVYLKIAQQGNVAEVIVVDKLGEEVYGGNILITISKNGIHREIFVDESFGFPLGTDQQLKDI